MERERGREGERKGGEGEREKRERHLEVPALVLVYSLLQNLSRLNCVAAQTVSAFAVDEYLQNHLLHAGVLFHLLLFVFNYDYTLDEGGVETSDETNLQEVANNLARLTIVSVGRLAGLKSKALSLLTVCTNMSIIHQQWLQQATLFLRILHFVLI